MLLRLSGPGSFAVLSRGTYLELDGTSRATAEHGSLDVQTRPERRNAVKVLLLLDVGGSMDPHVRVVEELFSAARAEFKHLEYYYFHNCVYEKVYRDASFREAVPLAELLRTYNPEHKLIMVGDAGLSESLLAEFESTLDHHELIKVKVNALDRDDRSRMIDALVEGFAGQRINGDQGVIG